MNRARLFWVFNLLCRLAVGGVFVVASLGKLIDPVQFLGAVDQYQILPHFALPFFAAGLPAVEMICGLSIIAGFQVRANALLICGMMGMFIVAMVSAIFRHIYLDCGCFDLFGESGSPVGWNTVARDSIILLPALWLLFVRPGDKTRPNSPSTDIPHSETSVS